jgi:tripartite ATP-independent transporter DctP family solute receptor
MKLRLISALAAASFAAAIGPANADVKMRLAHYAPENHPANLASLEFARNVAARTAGEVKVDIFANNALGTPPEQMEQIKLGTIDMGLPTQGLLGTVEKAFATVMLPFAFDSYDQAHRVLDGPALDWLKPLAEKQGILILANWEYGFRHLTNDKRAVLVPEDVAGLKIRVPPEFQQQAAMDALGAQTTRIPLPELYTSLSQGAVDGQENPISVIFHNKLNEVQKHLALTKHIYNNMMLVISAPSWAKLTPAQQAIFLEEGAKSGLMMRKAVIAEEEEQVAKLEKAGMQISKPDLAAFRAKMGPAYAKIGAFAGEENLKRFLEILEKSR